MIKIIPENYNGFSIVYASGDIVFRFKPVTLRSQVSNFTVASKLVLPIKTNMIENFQF